MFATRTFLKQQLASITNTKSTYIAAVCCARNMSTKVAVLGAGGGIGQPLSMLLKLSPEIDELACYDIVGTPGIAADLSHVSSFWDIHNTCTRMLHKHKDNANHVVVCRHVDHMHINCFF